MIDTTIRALERVSAADPSPENEERLARAHCKAGEHEWSPWRNVEAWDGERPLAVGGRPAHFELRSGQRCVLSRVCFWCFAKDHKRVQGKPVTDTAVGGGVTWISAAATSHGSATGYPAAIGTERQDNP